MRNIPFLSTVLLAALGLSCTADVPSTVLEPRSDPATTGGQPRSTPAPLYAAASVDERGRPDHYIVKLTDEFVAKDDTYDVAAQIIGVAQAEGRKTWPTFRGFYARIPKDMVDKVRQHPLVAYVEEDRRIEEASAHTKASRLGMDTGVAAPPWYLDRIDEDAYPLDFSYNYDYSGDGVRIYVIDSGIRDTHEDFGSRATTSFQADLDWDPPFGDCRGHGTQVASAAAGTDYGVAKNATVIGVRIKGCSSWYYLGDLVDGMEWVASNRILPAVANISLPGVDLPFLESPSDAAADLIDAGVVVVKSAGNDNQAACGAAQMHSVTSVLVVGALAVGTTDSKASFSNYGSCVDLYAPGDAMTLADKDSDSDSAFVSGTSFAAPLVAGAAAMYLGLFTCLGGW